MFGLIAQRTVSSAMIFTILLAWACSDAEPEAGSVDLRIGGTNHGGGSTIIVSPDQLSGSFALDSGYAGEWVCAELVTQAGSP